MIPKAKGGTLTVTACYFCNHLRGNRPLGEFLFLPALGHRRKWATKTPGSIKPATNTQLFVLQENARQRQRRPR